MLLKNRDKTGARKNGPPGWGVFTGRGDPGLLADFFFTFFSIFKNFVFCFFRKNRISLVHMFGSVLVLDYYPSFSFSFLFFIFFLLFFFFFSFFFFFCSDDIVRIVDPFGSRGLATLITKRLVRVEYECAKCPRVRRRRSRCACRSCYDNQNLAATRACAFSTRTSAGAPRSCALVVTRS
jgi:hypothetical protein